MYRLRTDIKAPFSVHVMDFFGEHGIIAQRCTAKGCIGIHQGATHDNCNDDDIDGHGGNSAVATERLTHTGGENFAACCSGTFAPALKAEVCE